MARPITANPPTNTAEGKRVYMQNWWAKNKHRKKEYDSKFYKRHKDKLDAQNLKYYYENRDKIRAWSKQYTQDNKEKLLPMWQRNYLKRRATLAGVKSERYEKLDIYIRDNGVCCICKDSIEIKLKWPHPQSFSIQHLIPLSKGGDNTTANVASSHLVCNMRQSTKLMEVQNG